MTDPQPSESAAGLTRRIQAAATELGFQRSAVCPASAPDRLDLFHDWLDAGYAGEMRYLEDRRDAYSHPRHVLEGVRSVLMLCFDYTTTEPRVASEGYGRVSRYAWGSTDYHDVVHERLKELVGRIRQWAPGCAARGVIDTAPMLERDFAQLAGLGWVGKNTLLLDKSGGSQFFLAAVLTDLALETDSPFVADHCGQCTACLDACPTDAFPRPYVLDARRCISYLTIELREPIPHDLRPGIGDWLFGCDVCQDVCPWNRHARVTSEPEFAARAALDPCELTRLFNLSDDEFRNEFRRSPLWRSRRRGILRNAAIVLGNQRAADAVATLVRALDDPEPLVRGAVAWALGQIGGEPARSALAQRNDVEEDEQVLHELRLAMA